MSVKLIEPTLLALHTTRMDVFEKTKKAKQEAFTTWEASHGTISAFLQEVRSKGKSLQEATLKPIPAQNELEKQKQEVLTKYWDYKDTLQKVALFGNSIRSAIQSMTLPQRTDAEEKALKQSPGLHEQAIYIDRVFKEHIDELNAMLTETEGLKNKYELSLNDNTLHWAILRFVALVDNQGQPIVSSHRYWNYLSTSWVGNMLVSPSDIPKPTPPVPPAAGERESGSTSSSPTLALPPSPRNEDESGSGSNDAAMTTITLTPPPSPSTAPASRPRSSSSPEMEDEGLKWLAGVARLLKSAPVPVGFKF